MKDEDTATPTPTPPSTPSATPTPPTPAASAAHRALTALHGDEEWIDEANVAGAAISSGSPEAAIDALGRKAIVLDALFFRTIEDAARAPLGKRAALIREARGLERDQRMIREEIERLRRRIVTPARE